MRISKVLPLLLTLCFAGCPIFGQVDTQDVKAIRFGKLIDGTGKVSTNAIVIVKGDRIQSIASADTQIPKGARVIDLSAFTGMP
jgi:imidazolonepropionase-like amidohydrolase